jgi:hypothetical protein
MSQTLFATFDGKALAPENGVELVAGTRYKVVIQDIDNNMSTRKSAWEALDRLVGTVEGPADWASELDHYLYGKPKRNAS